MRAALTVVHGPAGFGKTALLADWVRMRRAEEAEVIWFSAEPEDADFAAFAAELLNQLRVATEGSALARLPLTSTIPIAEPESTLAAIHDAAAVADVPIAVVVDDFSAIDVPDFTRRLGRALRRMPPNLHFVLACRTLPETLLALVGGSGDLPVVGPGSLRFSGAELDAILGDHPIDREALEAATGGWPRIVSLLAAQLDAGEPPALERLLGSDPVHGYVTRQVLAGLDDRARGALIRLSSLSAVPAELAESALGEEDASRLAAAAQRIGPLVRLSDEPRPVYRFHPVLLRSLRRHRSRLALSARRAVDDPIIDWFIRRHAVSDALDYALRQSMPSQVARVVEHFGPHTITLHAGVAVLRAAFEVIDAARIVRSARLLIGRSVVLMKDGRFSLANAALENAQKLLGDGDGEPSIFGSPYVDLVCARYLMMLYNNDDFGEAFINDEQTEIKQLSVEDGIVGFVYALRSLWFQRKAAFRRAEAEAGRSLRHYRNARSSYGEASVFLIQGLCALAQGRLQRAERAYASAGEIVRRRFPDDPGLNAVCSVLRAEVEFERNELDAAAGLLDPVLDALEEHDGWLDPYAAAYRVGVGICLARGDAEGAEIVVDRASLLAGQRGLVEIERLAQLARVEIHLRGASRREAEGELRRYDEDRSAQRRATRVQDMWREQEALALARLRLLLAHGQCRRALERVAPMIEAAEAEGRYLQLTRLHAFAALAAWKRGDDGPAREQLSAAVNLAAGKGYVRLFVDYGAELVALLQHLADDRRTRATRADRFVRRILRAIRAEQGASGNPVQFSARELQVLSYLGRGHSNKQIARELDVTESTIKFHLKKIFAKLGVKKRGSASVEAQRLGLI